jgi:2'-5' RNA ligase
MRLFTALDFPPDVHAEIVRVQTELKHLIEVRRWQSMRQAHLTVDFLGETPESLLEPLGAMFERVCREAAPFELALGAFGGFPNLHRAKVLWIGVGGERDSLIALEARMRQGFMELGLQPDERSYKPHITLAREVHKSPVLDELPTKISVTPLSWRVTEMVLFHSELRPEGAVHTPLGRYGLGKSSP